MYTHGACAFTERTAFLVLLSRFERRKHAHTNINVHTSLYAHTVLIYKQTRTNILYSRRRMVFRRTYLSHRRRHEELAENNMQYEYL